jgi:Ca-activated chloride channel family protein
MTNSILGALVNGAIVGALLAGAVRAGLLLTPRGMLTAAARYAVWWTVLVAAVLLPLAYLSAQPARHVDAVSHRAAPVGQTTLTSLPVPSARAPLMPADRPALALHLGFPLALTVGGWLRWIPMAWASLSGWMLLRLLASCMLLVRRKSGAVAAPEELIRRIEASLARRGSTRRAAVLRSTKIGTPMLAGLRRPAILIPERLFTELTEEELAQIGLHEAAHLARRDDYALLAARAIEAALPFHPVVRWIVRRIDLERELACDDFVVESIGAPRSYAACLLRVVELCSGARAPWAATGVAGNRSQLTKRVDRLLERNRGTDARTGKARLLTAIGVVAALACLAGRAPGAIALAIPPAVVQPPQIASPPAMAQPPAAPRKSTTPAPPPAAPQKPTTTPAPAAPQTPALVVLPLTVQDSAHRYVSGLTKASFQVFEDGVEQQISDVSVDDPPLSVEIVVDMSGSMRNKQALVDAAVTQLVRSANPADEFLVVMFSDHLNVAGAFRNELGQILNQLHLEQPRGGTALRDAIFRAAEWKDARYPDRILVAISDGVDNSSSVSIEELRDAALAARAPIWAITIASPETYPGRESLWLRDMAEQSLGHEFVSDEAGQVADTAASIANQTRYVLKYNSTNQALDGKYRRVKVDVVTAPPGTFKIAARMGYYATGR